MVAWPFYQGKATLNLSFWTTLFPKNALNSRVGNDKRLRRLDGFRDDAKSPGHSASTPRRGCGHDSILSSCCQVMSNPEIAPPPAYSNNTATGIRRLDS